MVFGWFAVFSSSPSIGIPLMALRSMYYRALVVYQERYVYTSGHFCNSISERQNTHGLIFQGDSLSGSLCATHDSNYRKHFGWMPTLALPPVALILILMKDRERTKNKDAKSFSTGYLTNLKYATGGPELTGRRGRILVERNLTQNEALCLSNPNVALVDDRKYPYEVFTAIVPGNAIAAAEAQKAVHVVATISSPTFTNAADTRTVLSASCPMLNTAAGLSSAEANSRLEDRSVCASICLKELPEPTVLKNIRERARRAVTEIEDTRQKDPEKGEVLALLRAKSVFAEEFAVGENDAETCSFERDFIIDNSKLKINGPSKVCADNSGCPGSSVWLSLVIDGHGGHQVAEYVRQHLPAYVAAELCTIVEAGKNVSDKGEFISTDGACAALARAFERLDDTLYFSVESAFSLGLTNSIKVGACCVAALVTPKHVIVANSGDCLAVLVRKNGSEVIPLNEQQNANCPRERRRLKEEHPGEADVVVCKKQMAEQIKLSELYKVPLYYLGLSNNEPSYSACYVKGRLQPTRVFGDFILKKQKYREHLYRGRRQELAEVFVSYPYVTVRPSVTVQKRESSDSCLIMGTDGIWDLLTPKEASDIAMKEIKKCKAENREVVAKRASQAILDAVLMKAARESGFATVNELRNQEAKRRRRCVDDSTVTVILL